MFCEISNSEFGSRRFSIFISFAIFSFSRVKTNLLIILLKSSKVLTSFRELSLFHTLPNIPVNEGPLGVHEVKLVVQPSPGLSNSCGVGEHADCTSNLCLIPSWHNGWWLVVDANLESCGTPVNKLDAPLGLDGCDGSVHVLGDHISSVEKTACHVLAMTRVTLHHLVSRLKASIGDLRHSYLFMVSLLSRNDGSIGHKREVDPWVRHQVRNSVRSTFKAPSNLREAVMEETIWPISLFRVVWVVRIELYGSTTAVETWGAG